MLRRQLQRQRLGFSSPVAIRGADQNSQSIPSQTPPEPVAPLTIPSPTVSPQAPTQKSFEAPPIITYPEFLTTPQRPAPLITAKRLLNTLYLFGSLSALLYGTNKYLLKPMIASLTSSRHELAETAQENVEKLVEKLEGVVSEKPQALQSQRRYDTEDEDSDSDPTELFHRDIGVQTSIPNSPSNSRPRTPTPSTQVFETQTRRLATLTSHLKDLNEASTSEGQDTEQLSTCVSILKDYLDSMAYVQPTFSYGGGSMYNNPGQKTEAADDEIAKVKAQIKSMKGVMLSARSFPAGTWQRQSTLVR